MTCTPRHFTLSLAQIRENLDRGPELLAIAQAASALGVKRRTLATWTSDRKVRHVTQKLPGRGRPSTAYHRDELWRFAQDAWGIEAWNDGALTAVRCMLERWQDCATIQELHDAAGVQPLPAYITNQSYRRSRKPVLPDGYEFAYCERCGDEFKRQGDADGEEFAICHVCRRVATRRRGMGVMP
jgi:hypothetical protein